MADDINRSNWSDHSIEANNSSRRTPTNSHQQHHQIFGPKTIIVHRKDGHGFGFTLRHFIVYPPDSCTKSSNSEQTNTGGALNLTQPMDTVFVKEVRPYGPAHFAGLQTGDRLLSVNGMPVAGTPYNRVVATIQQAPSSLTLSVVPKECDILQTFFSETAHNPETNQRPRQPCALTGTANTPKEGDTAGKFAVDGVPEKHVIKPSKTLAVQFQRDISNSRTKDSVRNNNSANSDMIYSDPYTHYRSRAEPQAASDIHRRGEEILQIHHGHASSIGNGQVRLQANYNPIQNNIYANQRRDVAPILAFDPHLSRLISSSLDRRESSASATSSVGSSYESGSTLTSDLGDNAIMTRLRKSVEQKEEFLRGTPVTQSQVHGVNSDVANIRHREFYARPKRLQKTVWPPQEFDSNNSSKRSSTNDSIINNENSGDSMTSSKTLSEHSDNSIAIQRNTDIMPLQVKSTNTLPPHRLANNLAREQFYNGIHGDHGIPSQSLQQQHQQYLQQRALDAEGNCRMLSPPPGIHIVSERTKQFESGRPLSPDGSSVDRTSLYRSELSRLSTKRVVPNVALRRKEFELKANESIEWRRLSSGFQRIPLLNIFTRAKAIKKDENDRSESTDRGELFLQDRSDRTRSLSADSTRNESDKFNIYYEPQDFRRKMRPQTNSVQQIGEDEDRPVRRVSYLRATANENALTIDSDVDNSPMSAPPGTPDDLQITQILRSAYRPWRRPKLTSDIQPLRKIFEETPKDINLPPTPTQLFPDVPAVLLPMLNKSASTISKAKALSYLRETPADPIIHPVILEGELHLKITYIDSKRSPDRSWRTVTAEIRGTKLKMTIHREGKSNQSPEPSGIIDLRSFHVTEGNYTKRKHVFKLTSAPIPSSPLQSPSSAMVAGTELLIQADSHQDMKLWMESLRKASCADSSKSLEYLSELGSQTAEPQRIAATTTIQTQPPAEDQQQSNSTVRKYLGSRSPSGQSPVTKSRKTPQNVNVSASTKESSDREIGSPKSRTWKGLVARQFRKIQGQPSSPNSNYVVLPEGASIGVPLAQCPMSDDNEFVPLLVARCTHIVETKGLSIVGIYRIPGNTAAISALTEQVNRGFDDQTLNDPKWDDVNVVSSLLKLFIRSLPDALLPNDMYGHFIEVDKETGQERLIELKSLLERLPSYSYETLKHLMRHLSRISRNCHLNLMEPKNLAIIFGPSVVRTSNETLETVVKDMKHQCRIVEALVSHYDFFFESAPTPSLAEAPEYASVSPPELQTNMLLDNVSKIETLKDRDSARFVTKFVQAATNRKTRKPSHRKFTLSTPDTLSLDSSTSAESKDQKTTFTSEKSSHQIRRSSANDDAIKSRLSEDESNDSAFADNGSMSLTTVTLALDDKLRSLRNSSFDSDKDLDLDTSIDSTINHQPLTLGENIPFADESPERPLIQSRSKPVRVSTYSIPTSRYTTRLYSHGSTSPNSPQDALSSSQSHSSEENVKGCTTSDDTDASTTSNPMEAFPSSVRIDRDMIREMNRILTTLERKATKLNRSLSLNYKNHKGECCCNMNNLNNSYRSGSNRLPLTKDEKTDKNINKKRQIQDGKSRRYTNRSIKRRHTVGGTHDYDVNKSGQNVRCRQGHQMGADHGQRTSSPDLVKDNHIDKVICVNES
ncbi:rho GTPase-activating protein 21 isoform X7 [Bradysia coprophila]|uniref:rho GTPase-activating protein 21 isoform X7 n=1 Tax=Bradysia coprophila TaxID=38358 RepID=UPI00187D87C6|nr:rho GTPase-activating protein 21 isoform X7 [Bradysia coprophila]